VTSPRIGNQLFVVVTVGIGLLASLVARYILPERFLFDDQHLQTAMDPQTAYLTDGSFQDVAAVYTALGLEDAAPIAALLSVGIFVVCVFVAVGWERMRDCTLLELAAICTSVLIAVVYLGQYSKELVTLAIAALLLAAPRGRSWDLVIAGACLAYGGIVRPYWLLVGVLFLVWRFALSRARRPSLLLLVPLLAYIGLQPAFGIALGGGLQSQREEVNSIRDNADSVGSLIVSPLPDTAGPVGIIAALLMLLIMIFPVPLLLTGSPFHVVSALLILGIWMIVIIPIARGRAACPPDAPRSRPQVRATRSAALLLSLLLVQALFEPDFGSYLKHLTPLLPLALTLLPSVLRAEDVPTEEPAAHRTAARAEARRAAAPSHLARNPS
jgi:hypothetical protein